MTTKKSKTKPKSKPKPLAKAKPKTIAKARLSGLAIWQEQRAITDTEAAAALGLARNTFVKHRDTEAPLTTRLALAAIVAGLEPVS